MLLARGHRSIGSAQLAWTLLFAKPVWAISVERRGLILDTRFVPAPAVSRRRSCVYFLLSGTWLVRGERTVTLTAPRAWVVTASLLDGGGGGRRSSITFAASGEPFRALELHLRGEDLDTPALDFPTPLDGVERAIELAEEVTRAGDSRAEGALNALLGELARARVIRPSAAKLERASRSAAILWRAMRPMIERLYVNPTLQELRLDSSVSLRQLDRYVEDFVGAFGLPGSRWRSSLLHLRVKLAVLMLSADEASVGDVATALGYGSSDAMARSFRDAGLPPPTQIRRQIRDANG